MLAMEPLDAANIVDVSLQLPDEQRYRRERRWPVQRSSVGMVLQRPCVPQVLERLVL